MIYVYDAFWCRYIPIPAVDQEYAKGLTEWQHEVICKFIRRTNQARVDRKALAEAKEYIRQRIAEEFGRKSKKLKSAKNIARWLTFEDPAEVKIIYHSKNGKKSQSNGKSDETSTDNSTKLLKSGNNFIPPSGQPSKPIEWSEGEKWDSLYDDFDEEEL
jgi:oligoribonuclease NrnB/cAMP/cGMP phosphodiesterase (DHH superfamily)